MRIITGDFKGRRLEMPVGNDIRPTTEKVKEALFSMIAGNLYDAVCADLFSGTGNLGLEALSRGAEKCYFADNNRASLELTRRNIAMCRAEGGLRSAEKRSTSSFWTRRIGKVCTTDALR